MIRASVLRDISLVAQKNHPNEFIALLGVGEKSSHVVSELVYVPFESGRTFSGLYSELIPFDELVVGTVHSHPSPSAFPSDADLNVFSRMGRVHLIIAYPYSPQSIRAYSSKGKPISLRTV